MSVHREYGAAIALNSMLDSIPLAIKDVLLTGSYFLCGTGEDIDVVILVEPAEEKDACGSYIALEQTGWRPCLEENYTADHDFMAYRRGDFNLIVLEDSVAFDGWVRARNVLLVLPTSIRNSKDWRVLMHRLIRDGASPQDLVIPVYAEK